jgi:hypothetical protein
MSKTIVFFPEGAYSPTNDWVGIGDVLRLRGRGSWCICLRARWAARTSI